LAKLRLAAERVTCGATPVPAKFKTWGEPAALSAMATEADRLPVAEGVKVTEMIQLAPAATLSPQVFVWLKSAALVPAIATLVMDSAALPEFETVTVWAALAFVRYWVPNVRLEGVSEICAIPTPVPFRAAVCGEPAALSVTVIKADRAPAREGMKVTEMVQLAPAPKVASHVLVWLKSDAFVPVTVMPVRVTAALPGLESMIV
jgi:hypothetical protein